MTAAGRRGLWGGTGTVLAALMLAGSAAAAGCNCNKPPPPPPPNCDCGQQGGGQGGGHQAPPPGGWGSGVGYGSSSSSSSSSASASATATVNASAFANSTALAAAYADVFANSSALSSAAASSSGVIYNGGGGSNFYVEQGSSGVIPNLQVEGVASGEARRICAEYQAVAKTVAVEATCLDDKDVPHPASQVSPERELAPSYEGEVYRCIAGARMQYTLGAFAGTANFDHGQTVTCGKAMALYHTALGELVCRAQKPARDCNERSLLRRYGAGVKVLKVAAARQCVAYRSEQVAGQSSGGAMALDGGVGGVVH